jgi:DNA-binding PadR family transcriptional regulator
MRTPTATSYALLGLLAMRPWSSYELVKQMGRALHHVLPRAESNVYAEAKRLVVDGLATAEEATTGRRRRTTYTISDAGRAALDAWLRTPARQTSLESEALVKLLFATTLPLADTLRHIEAFGAEADRSQGPWAAIAEEYLDDRGLFPERLHVNTLFWVFQARYAAMQADWARWAAAFVATWPGPEGPGDDAVKDELRRELEATRPDPPDPPR